MTTTDQTAPSTTATIRTAGIEITAPRELILAAGWEIRGDIVVDASNNGFVTRRLFRALSESGTFPTGRLADLTARLVLARTVELGEIEGLKGRRDNARITVARLQAEAARDRKRAAELELQARADDRPPVAMPVPR